VLRLGLGDLRWRYRNASCLSNSWACFLLFYNYRY